MPDLKAMYRTIVQDDFPDTLTITLGDTVLALSLIHISEPTRL